eukprot:1271678-Pleurochrysis_carterae.AAC.2
MNEQQGGAEMNGEEGMDSGGKGGLGREKRPILNTDADAKIWVGARSYRYPWQINMKLGKVHGTGKHRVGENEWKTASSKQK